MASVPIHLKGGENLDERYERQLLLPQIGRDGQQKLRASRVLVCGAGGLGSPCLLYLAAMGVGHIGICDGDTVSLSNLNRQLLYCRKDLGGQKAEAAAAFLAARYPDTRFTVHPDYLTDANADALCAAYDIAADCLDNRDARLTLNDACLRTAKPFVHGGVTGFSGQVTTVIPGKTACLRCAGLPTKPQTPGILGAAAGVIGSLEALELCLYLTGNDPCTRLFVLDLLLPESYTLPVTPNPNCICQHI